jgi:hypothetical protein
LSKWFNRRFAGGGKRAATHRHYGAVAPADALLAYLEHGLIPDK